MTTTTTTTAPAAMVGPDDCAAHGAPIGGLCPVCLAHVPTTTIERVATFVREHAVRAEVRDGVVWGEAVYVSVWDDDETSRVWEPIGETFGEARDWLGY